MIKNAFILFGATGDLAQRKLYPALAELNSQNQLNEETLLVGVSRRDWSSKRFNEFIKSSLEEFDNNKNDEKENQFYKQIPTDFVNIEFGKLDMYKNLSAKLAEYKVSDKIFIYLAIEPRFYEQVIQEIFESEVYSKFSDKLVFLVEKPFGQDYETAQQLNKILRDKIPEDRIIRVDHVVNRDLIIELIEFRKLNPGFDQLFSNKFIQEIQVSYSEKLGVESRPEFYDKTGALKDMVQSHLLQILQSALRPVNSIESIIDSFSLLDSENPERSIVRAQYKDYKKVDGIPNDSKTETYVALALESDHKLWQKVPIYIRTGKKLTDKNLDINLILKNESKTEALPNLINVRVYPNPAINFVMQRKNLHTNSIENITLNHCYSEKDLSDAYTNIFRKLFSNELDEIENNSDTDIYSSWKLIDQISELFSKTELEVYEEYSDGPNGAERLLKNNSTNWISTTEIQKCQI